MPQMNPKLIFKKKNNGCNSGHTVIHCIIVDSDIPKGYPANFLCVLPLRKGLIDDQRSRFSEIFGDKKVEIAKRLLIESLEIETDSKIKAEIKRRLRLID